MKENIPSFMPSSRSDWRKWLQEHHLQEKAVWLIYHKKNSGKPTVAYSDAVDEALCFGWIDSTSRSVDDLTYKQYFTVRKTKSVWSRVNKEKVERLIKENLMTEAGFKSIKIAKENGSWTILDEAEALIRPADLQIAFDANPQAFEFYETLSRTNKRNILQWLVLAKREETRQKRIQEIIEKALKGEKPKPFNRNKNSE